VFDISSSFFSSTGFSSLLSYKGASFFILMILSVFSVSVFGDLSYLHAQGSTVCDRQTFSLVNCPGSLSSDRDYGQENNEQQIPLIIPFP
jgi:hypothetical protein